MKKKKPSRVRVSSRCALPRPGGHMTRSEPMARTKLWSKARAPVSGGDGRTVSSRGEREIRLKPSRRWSNSSPNTATMSEEKPKVSPGGGEWRISGGTFNSCHCRDVHRAMAWFARFSESAQCVFPQMNERPHQHSRSPPAAVPWSLGHINWDIGVFCGTRCFYFADISFVVNDTMSMSATAQLPQLQQRQKSANDVTHSYFDKRRSRGFAPLLTVISVSVTVRPVRSAGALTGG